MIGSLVAPGLVLGIGVGLLFNVIGIETTRYTSALGAQLSWTLPFGVLVMFAVMSRFDPRLGGGGARSRRDRLADHPARRSFRFWRRAWWRSRCSASRLSYDEFARTLQTAGSLNTLPLEIWSMTLNVTSPSLYALGTVTTIISFVIIGVASAPSCSSRSGAAARRRRIEEA